MSRHGESPEKFVQDVFGLPDADIELIKSNKLLRLLGRLAVEHAALKRDLDRANERLKDARYDKLTGLLRREALEDEIEQLDQTRTYLVGMLDMRGLKHINDTYGHSAGDSLLSAGATALVHGLRADSVVGRWGGDEFVFAVPLGEDDDSEPIEARLRQAFGGQGIGEVCRIDEATAIHLSGRFGFQVIHPGGGLTVREALDAADNQMNQAANVEGSRGSAGSVAYAD